MKSHNRSFGLDLVRVVAISLVLLAHFAKKADVFGFWGVELFFALSGFLIGQILWRNYSSASRWSFKHILNFWSRRWWRTLPNYYLFLFLMIPYHAFIVDGLPSYRQFFNYIWFGQDFLSSDGTFYGISWSLCIEEWFYLSFPIILYLFSWLRLSSKISFTLTLVTFFVGCGLVREMLYDNGLGNSLRSVTLARLDSIASGVLVAFLSTNKHLSETFKIILFWSGIVFLSSPLVYSFYSGTGLHDLIQNRVLLILVPVGASLILPYINVLNSPDGNFSFLETIVNKLSLWSYSIYLSHIPLLFTVYYLLNNYRGSFYGNLFTKIIGLALTISVSGLLFNHFELPFTRKRPKEISLRTDEAPFSKLGNLKNTH